MNKVILVGRLTADPELRQTTSGVSSCRFSVAVTRNYKNQNGEYEADFIDCTAWRLTAEFVSRHFNKGKMILVEGSLRNSKYQDKKYPDVTHYKTEVFVDNVEFVGGKNDGGSQPQNNTYQAPRQQAPAPQQPAPANDNMSYGNLGEYEELLNEDDMPF